jgi:hypothetical protein
MQLIAMCLTSKTRAAGSRLKGSIHFERQDVPQTVSLPDPVSNLYVSIRFDREGEPNLAELSVLTLGPEFQSALIARAMKNGFKVFVEVPSYFCDSSPVSSRKMILNQEVEATLQRFIDYSEFEKSGAVITDLDGTAVHEHQGRIVIPALST